MTLSDSRRITDEMLSAFIDGEVTEQERALIEAALAQDQELVWRLDSLRQTVTFLRDLPELTLPRSFALTVEQLQMAPVAAEAERVSSATTPALAPRVLPQDAPDRQSRAGFWDQLASGWQAFWQVGNPVLRNAAAVSFALMLVLLGGAQFIGQATQRDSTMVATAPEAAPASESVALVRPTATESQPPSAARQAPSADSARSAPTGESAAAMQAPAPAADAQEESAPASDAATQGEAAVAEDAPDAESGEEAAAAAAMAAPAEEQPEEAEELAPLVQAPIGPGMGGGGMGGAGDAGGPPGAGGAEGGLVPEQAFEFDVDPLAEPTQMPAEDAVVASVAAAPASEAASEGVANIASTPAVDPLDTPEVSAADAPAARSATPAKETDEAAAEEPPAGEPEAEEASAQAESADVGAPESDLADTGAEAVTKETPAEETPEAVALVEPGAITSSNVVANVEAEGAEQGVVSQTGYALDLSLVTIAQGSALLLTVLFASLWWRSRTPRRPQR